MHARAMENAGLAGIHSLMPNAPAARNLLSRPPHRKRSERGRASGSEGVWLGQKRALAICAEIKEKATSMTLVEFLGAFGTQSLGVRRATLMVESNPLLADFERWFDGSLADAAFSAAAGVPKVGESIYADLKRKEAEIRETLQFVTLTTSAAPVAAEGKTFCITGSLPSGKKKKEYANILAAAGLLGNCFRARRTGNGQNGDGRRGVRGSDKPGFYPFCAELTRGMKANAPKTGLTTRAARRGRPRLRVWAARRSRRETGGGGRDILLARDVPPRIFGVLRSTRIDKTRSEPLGITFGIHAIGWV